MESQSNGQSERFDQDVKEIETRFLGRWEISIKADYCWSIMKDALHSRATKKRKFRLSVFVLTHVSLTQQRVLTELNKTFEIFTKFYLFFQGMYGYENYLKKYEHLNAQAYSSHSLHSFFVECFLMPLPSGSLTSILS